MGKAMKQSAIESKSWEEQTKWPKVIGLFDRQYLQNSWSVKNQDLQQSEDAHPNVMCLVCNSTNTAFQEPSLPVDLCCAYISHIRVMKRVA